MIAPARAATTPTAEPKRRRSSLLLLIDGRPHRVRCLAHRAHYRLDSPDGARIFVRAVGFGATCSCGIDRCMHRRALDRFGLIDAPC